MNNDKDKDKDLILFKIITLGDSNVGKSSIICRYLENKFYENFISTIGINKSQKEIILENGKKITLFLIDTSGQEKYNSISKQYIRNADGVLFVFDLSNKKTFNNIKKWIKIFYESNFNTIPKYLIGNKKDLPKDIDQDLIDLFSEENKIIYKETSAKDEQDGVINELFKEMAEKLYQNYIKKGKNKNLKVKKLNCPKEKKESIVEKCCL